MPEGDTIHRTAHNLRRALLGRVIEDFEASDLPVERDRVIGRRVAAVQARGKHLIIQLDDDHALHTHMRMSGAWHLYRNENAWRKPRRQARLVLRVADRSAVCFNAPVVEWLTPLQLAHHPRLSRLGPDLLDDEASLAEAVTRLQGLGSLPIGVALLRQDCVSGIGNVYKSEALFRAGLHPATEVSSIQDDVLHAILADTRQMMRANLGGQPRNTRRSLSGPRYAVYGRAGEACLTCGTTIERTHQGPMRRSTYWCPGCQPAT